MIIEIDLPYFNLEKAFEKATEEAASKLEDELYNNDDYRSIYRLKVKHVESTYHWDKYNNSYYMFTFEVKE